MIYTPIHQLVQVLRVHLEAGGHAQVHDGSEVGRRAMLNLHNRSFILEDEVTTMPKTLTYEIDADEAKQLEATVNECIAQMQQANQRMDHRQVEIDKLKAETRAMLNRIRELKAA
jgi:hypothetical protein